MFNFSVFWNIIQKIVNYFAGLEFNWNYFNVLKITQPFYGVYL